MTISPPPGCITDRGKVVLNDHNRYIQHLKSESFYHDLWNEKPGDSDLKYLHDGRVIRISGVLLFDRDGRDRPLSDILNDMHERIEYLVCAGAPGECIEQLEQYINEVKE